MILIYIFILIIIGFMLLAIKGKISYIGASCLVGAMSIPGLFYIPNISDDLYRYFLEMKFVSQFNNVPSLLYSYKYMVAWNYHKFTWLYNIFQWVISRIGIFNLLPFLTLFIVYLCLLIPSVHLRNKNNLSLFDIILDFLLVAILMPYGQISSTVRWCLASGLFFLITFMYLQVSHKYRFFILILYLPLIFIHEAMILPILLIIFCTFLPNIKWYYYLFYVIGFLGIFMIIIHMKSLSSNSIFGITKTYSQMSAGWSSSGSTILTFIFMWVIPFGYSIGSLLLIKYNKWLKSSSDYINIFIMFNLTDLLLSPIRIISQRYAVIVGFVNILLLMNVQKNNGEISVFTRNLYYFLLLMGFIILFISITHMVFNFSSIMQY